MGGFFIAGLNAVVTRVGRAFYDIPLSVGSFSAVFPFFPHFLSL